MKKLFNYALLAATLLVGVNVNAVDVAQIGNTKYSSVEGAFANAQGTAEQPDTITMLADADFATCRINLSDKYIIWDLAGNNVGTSDAATYSGFVLNRGYFKIINSEGANKPANLSLKPAWNKCKKQPFWNDHAGYAIQIYGSKTDETNYSTLIIDEYVNFIADNDGYAIKLEAAPNATNDGKDGKGKAYGVNIDVKGNVTGYYSALFVSGNIQEMTGTNFAFIHIYGSATLLGKYPGTPGKDDNDNSAAIGSGYAVWVIEGTLIGGTGLKAKSGIYTIQGDAVIRSNSDTYTEVKPTGSGFDGGAGNGIVFDSSKGYAGGMVITIKDNATIEGNAGYAFHESISDAAESMTEGLIIESGSLVGGEKGCLDASATLQDKVKIEGTITGGTFTEDITNYLSNVDGVITPTTDEAGNTVYVVTTGPATDQWKSTIGQDATEYVKLTTGTTQTLSAGGKAAYLVEEGTAKVTIPAGKTLEVGEIVMSKDAQIIVEKGAKLIVKGTKGIVANQASNIILKSEENAPAYFLLDPQVTSNKTPKATVQFTSNSWYVDAEHYQYQYFGAPMVGGAIESVKPLGGFTKRTIFYVWNKTSWVEGGYIENTNDQLKYEAFQNPFGFYAMVANTPQGTPTEYEMTGRLFGNTNPEVPVIKGYVPMSNGFTANMDGDLLIQQLETTTIEKAAWAPKSNADGSLQWQAYTELRKLEEVKPMGTFMVKNDGSATTLNLDYKSLVWDPVQPQAPGAPRANRYAMATVRVEGCGLNDIVTVAEDNQFSADFDNGFDAEKYENTSIRFYVNAEKEYDIFATDNVNNTFVGLMTTKAGKYTISFEDVTGNFALVDNKTNARIEMSEGTTYEFLAEAGEDAYRFMIVEAAKAPTEMQKTNAAVKATRALINGQIVISNGERFINVLGAKVK